MKFGMSPLNRAFRPSAGTNNNNNNNNNINTIDGLNITATLDLHGFTRSKAISTLTQFLDQVTTVHLGDTDIWVQVITGSGIHSTEGPVLRDAVKNLLTKRQMIFSLNKGKGSFTVKANSGQVLLGPGPPIDTKVIVQPTPEVIPQLPHQQRQHHHQPRGSRRYSSAEGGQQGSTMMTAVVDPIPAEVARVDRIQADVRRDEVSFSEALKISAARADTEEDKLLEQAMRLSMIEGKDREEDSTLEQALALSQQVFTEQVEEEELLLDSELQAALEQSERELLFSQSGGGDSDVANEGDLDELQKVLELSRRESSIRVGDNEDERLLEILQESTRNYEQERLLEEQALAESLEQALALSLQESKPSPQNYY